MSLINPLALWLLLLLPIPLLLARRRRPLRRQVVSNLYLWRNLASRDPAQVALRRVRRTWLVALQVAFMAASIAALARPTMTSLAPRVALIVDVSGSMGARDGSTTRLDRARDRARSIIGRLPRRSHVQLVAAGASPRLLGEYAPGDAALAHALAALTPTAGSADLLGAISLAIGAGARGGNIHVFSDRSTRDLTAQDGLASGAIAWETVGQAAENLAVTRLAARRLPLDPVDGQILVEVRNYGSRPRETEIELAQDGQVIAREAVRLAAHDDQTIVVHASQIGHVIGARLLGDDALEADNHRLTVVPPVERVPVVFAGAGNLFLEKSLAVNPGIALSKGTAGEPSSGGSKRQDASGGSKRQDPPYGSKRQDPPYGSGGAVVVCNSCAELPAAANGVLIVPPPAGAASPAALTVSLPDHPLAASLDMGELLFATPVTSGVVSAGDGDVILRAGGVPAVIVYEHDGRRIVEIRLDLTRSDFTLGTAFPILVANAIDWLAARNENPLEILSGEPLRWVMPESGTVEVTGPDDRPARAQVAGGYLTVADTDAPGAYRVHTATTEQVFVVNPAVDTESDLTASAPETQIPSKTVTASSVEEKMEIAPSLLVLALALLVLEWWLRRPSRPTWHLVTATCLILAAFGVQVPTWKGPVSVVAALDRSGSMPARAQDSGLARVNGFAGTMKSGDRLGVVAFAADAVVEARPAGRVQLPAIRSTVADTRTDIGAGLRLARAALPRQGSRRIVLMSDGRETVGSAEREAAAAAADGIRVDIAAPELTGMRRPPVATRVVAPPQVRIGEPFLVSVELEGSPGGSGQLSVYRDDQPFETRNINLPTAGTAGVAFSDRHQQAGVHIYRAVVRDPQDDFQAPESLDAGSGAVVSVSGEPAVLYVSAGGGTLRASLGAAGFRVAAITPEAVPVSAGALAAYDAIVIEDVPSERFGTAQMLAVARYVEQSGGGLLLLGSSRSLTLAGYPTGPLGGILPVDLRPRAGSRAPSLGLVLIFDKSGSMADLAAGTPKIELARQSVMRVLGVLPSTDSLGVIAFDAAPVVIASLAPAQDARTIADRLRTIEPGGSTQIAPAFEMALQWLRGAAADVARRQILVVSDGRTSTDDATRLRAAVGSGGVEVSVVAIGANADRGFLQELADSSGGRAYFPADAGELPLIVAREAARSAGGRIVEEPFALRGAAHPVLAGIDRTSLPHLTGYVVSAAKPTATTILASHLDDPILCVWRTGLGRVGVFTADLGSAWSASLRGWNDDARLWAQSVRWLSRRTDDQSLRLTMTGGNDSTRISVEAQRPDGNFLTLADVHAVVRFPSGEARDIGLHAAAPGLYEARVPTSSAGPYVVSVAGVDADGGTEHHIVGGSFWSADQERRFQSADLRFLKRLADMTGGRVLGPADSPFSGTRSPEYRDISTWLVAAALLMFVLDIAVWRSLNLKGRRGWRWASRRSAHDRVAA